jgi:hypothetical protein
MHVNNEGFLQKQRTSHVSILIRTLSITKRKVKGKERELNWYKGHRGVVESIRSRLGTGSSRQRKEPWVEDLLVLKNQSIGRV